MDTRQIESKLDTVITALKWIGYGVGVLLLLITALLSRV